LRVVAADFIPSGGCRRHSSAGPSKDAGQGQHGASQWPRGRPPAERTGWTQPAPDVGASATAARDVYGR